MVQRVEINQDRNLGRVIRQGRGPSQVQERKIQMDQAPVESRKLFWQPIKVLKLRPMESRPRFNLQMRLLRGRARETLPDYRLRLYEKWAQEMRWVWRTILLIRPGN